MRYKRTFALFAENAAAMRPVRHLMPRAMDGLAKVKAEQCDLASRTARYRAAA